MNNILYTFLLACSVLLGGGCCTSETPEDLNSEKEPAEMIQIRNLTLTDETLTLNYRISNPFEGSIWVCYDIWAHGEQNVQDAAIRIDGETVWIKLHRNLGPVRALTNPIPITKYVRLLPGESFSGKIIENLPIKDHSRGWGAEHKEHKVIMLHRVVFEIGYIGTFGPKWKKWKAFLDSLAEKMTDGSIEPKPRFLNSLCYLPFNPLITEEMLDGQLHEVMYQYEYTLRGKNREFDEVLITDVDIPCYIVIDDK